MENQCFRVTTGRPCVRQRGVRDLGPKPSFFSAPFAPEALLQRTLWGVSSVGQGADVTRWFPGLPPVLPVTVALDAGNLVLSSWPGGVVQVWDPEAKEAIEEHAFAAAINAIRFQGDLTRLRGHRYRFVIDRDKPALEGQVDHAAWHGQLPI